MQQDISLYWKFYQEWKRAIFGFHWLVLLDRKSAEGALEETFVSHSRKHTIWAGKRPPVELLRCAVDAALNAEQHTTTVASGSLERDLLPLSREERIVLVLRLRLKLPNHVLPAATGFSKDRLSRLWISVLSKLTSASLHVPDMLPKQDASETTCGCRFLR